MSSVLSYHNDISSSGVNSTETLLTPTTVNATQFGKQFTTPVDGQIYGEPLYVPGVSITTGVAQGVHNVTYVTTEHDSVYAVDAVGGNVLWQDSFIYNSAGNPNPSNPAVASGVTTIPSQDTGSADISPELGITSTPVISAASNCMYVTASTKGTVNGYTHYYFTLYKLSLSNGQIQSSKIVGDTIFNNGVYSYRATDEGAGTDPYVLGTGDGSESSQAAIDNQPAVNFGQSRVYFNALRQMNRPGLTLANGSLYIGFASHGDNGPYHGWVLRFDPGTLTLTGVVNTTPNGGLGGTWQGGGITAVDSAGNLYFETGNGSFNTNSSNFPNNQYFPADHDYGDCFVKVSTDTVHNSPTNQNTNGWGLQINDYFSPYNNATLNSGDEDLGSGGPVVLPDAVGSTAHPHLLIGAGKEGKIYLIDRDHMGGFSPTTDNVVETQANTSTTGINGSLNTPAFFLNGAGGTSGTLYYFPGYGGNGRAFTISNGFMTPAYTSQTTDTFGSLDGTPSVSANGTSNGLVWVVDRGSNQLRAYDATNLANEVWTSAQAANNRDLLNPVTKFSVPAVADGHVFVGTSNALVAYGPPNAPTSAPIAPTNLAATAQNYKTVVLTWQDNSNNEDQFLIERSPDNATWTQIGSVGTNVTTYTDSTALATTQYFYRVRAYNSFSGGSYSAYTNTANVTTPAAPSSGTGDGLAASFWADSTHMAGTPALVRTDPTINFNWNSGSPGAGIGSTNFSVKWTGQFTPTTTETYTFHTTSDDGVRLAVNGTLLINDYTGHAATNDYATMALVAGQTYSFEMDYFQGNGGDVAMLHWSSPSIADQAIPLLNGGATGQYFNDTATISHLAGIPLVTRVDPQVDSTTWVNNAPATSIGNTLFSAEWTGKVQPSYSENYTFYTESDDGVRLYVNGQLLINDWTDHSLTQDSASITLSAGQEYSIEMDYYQGQGADQAQLLWSSPSTPKQLIPQSQLYSGVAPAAPSNLAAVAASGTQLNLSWTNNSNIQTGLDLERKIGVNGTLAPVTTSPLPANTTSYVDTALTPGTTYFYEIRALNFAANSPYSQVLQVATPYPPAKPSNAHATANSTTAISLAWTDNATNEDGYRVLRSTAGSDFFTIATLPANSTSYTDTGSNGAGLTPGTEYEYHIQAFNVAGYNDFSGADTATLTLAPTGLTAATGAGSVNLGWTAPSYKAVNATQLTFNVYRGTTAGGESTVPIATGLTTNAFIDSSAVAGNTYYYKVTAVEIGGESAASTEASAAASAVGSTVYVSSLTPTYSQNGYGAVGINTSNGGNAITLKGVKYAQGLGVHAVSDLVFPLKGQFTTFISDIGIDDEVAGKGSVDFQVKTDGGVLVYDSGTITGTSPTQTVTLNVTGKQSIELLVQTTNSTIDYDHADWAAARLLSTTAIPPSVPGGLATSSVTASTVALTWQASSGNNGVAGYNIYRNGAKVGTSPTTSYTDTGLLPSTAYSYTVSAYDSSNNTSAQSTALSVTTAAPGSTVYISSLTPTYSQNGYGAVGINTSNGGNVITLRGTTYPYGLGVHANSDLVFPLKGQYTTFTSDIGIDDEVGGKGSVDFQIKTDNGVLLYDSGTITGASPVKTVSVDVTGKQSIELLATTTNGTIDYDHADWAGARLFSTTKLDTQPPSQPTNLANKGVTKSTVSLAWTASTDNVGVAGYKIYRNGTLIGTAGSNAYTDLGLTANTSYSYTVAAFDAAGNLSPQSTALVALTSATGTTTYLSNLTPTYVSNGYGSLQNDKSNGGNAITLRGTTYAKGLGVHAASDVKYLLNGAYTTFTADIGVDDEVGAHGAVDFQVLTDNGVVLYDSGTVTSATAVKTVTLNVTGKQSLELIVKAVGTSIDYDHADWAGARVS